MRLLFLGTGSLGIPTLQALLATDAHELNAIFTQPDRPAGRGLQLKPSPVKEFAIAHGVPCYQPEKINKDLERVRSFEPDVIVVAAYGQLLSKDLLAIPSQGTINIHASLLPRFRGAAPIQWALIRGETETGVTTFLIDEGLDTGDVLLKKSLVISEDDTAGSLEAKLASLGADVMLATLSGIASRTLRAQPQDHSKATLAPKIRKEMALIDWSKSAREIFNLVRGLNPSPGAFTLLNGRRLKIHRSSVMEKINGANIPGEILELGDQGPVIQTGSGLLVLTAVQPEGKKQISGDQFISGYQIRVGDRLG